MTLLKAAKQALEALEEAYHSVGRYKDWEQITEAVEALRQAIESEEKQEPVAWANPNDLQNFDMKVRTNGGPLHTVPLYMAQPQREWVELTDEEIYQLGLDTPIGATNFARAILAKAKEKNT